MTTYECPRCKYEDDVEWKISAYGLTNAVINFKCPKCKLQMGMQIEFPEDEKEEAKTKIEYDEANYIG